MKKALIFFFAILSLKMYAFQKPGETARKSIIITGSIWKFSTFDTLILDIHGDLSRQGSELNVIKKIKYITRNSKFRFEIPDPEPATYVTLWISSKGFLESKAIVPTPLFKHYLLRPGDSVQVNTDLEHTYFTGNGATRLNSWKKMEESSTLKNLSFFKYYSIEKAFQYINLIGSQKLVYEYHIGLLEALKPKLSKQDYLDFKANITATYWQTIYQSFKWADFGNGLEGFGDSLLRYYEKNYYGKRFSTNPLYLNPNTPTYITMLFYKTITDLRYEELIRAKKKRGGQAVIPNEHTDYIPLLVKQYKGDILDHMLVTYMMMEIAGSAITDTAFKSLLRIVKNERSLEVIEGMYARYAKGQPVSGFAFSDAQDRSVTLDNYKGKVVFIDMWFTGCTGCVTVAKALPDVEAAFKDNPDVKFVSLCIDLKKDKWLKSINPENTAAMIGGYRHYTTPTTDYLFTGGTGENNDFIRKYVPTGTYPHLMIIDRNGKIFSAAPPRPDANGGQQALIELIRSAAKIQ